MPSFNIPTFDSSAHIKRGDPHRVMKGNVWTQQQNAAINITPPRSLDSHACHYSHGEYILQIPVPPAQEKLKDPVLQLRHFT